MMNTVTAYRPVRFGYYYRLDRPVDINTLPDTFAKHGLDSETLEAEGACVNYSRGGGSPYSPPGTAFLASDSLHDKMKAFFNSQDRKVIEQLTIPERIFQENATYISRGLDDDAAEYILHDIHKFNPEWQPTADEVIPLFMGAVFIALYIDDQLRERLARFLQNMGLSEKDANAGVEKFSDEQLGSYVLKRIPGEVIPQYLRDQRSTTQIDDALREELVRYTLILGEKFGMTEEQARAAVSAYSDADLKRCLPIATGGHKK